MEKKKKIGVGVVLAIVMAAAAVEAVPGTKPTGAGVQTICSSSAPGPTSSNRTWVRCSDSHLMQTDTSNVDHDLQAGGGLPPQGGNAGKFISTDGSTASWSPITLQKAYNGGSSIDIAGPGEGAAPVSITAHTGTDSHELFVVQDHSGLSLLDIFDSGPSLTNGSVFLRRLLLLGGDEIVSSGGLSPNDGDIMTYDAGLSKWYGRTLIPPQGGNSGKVLGTDGSTTSWVNSGGVPGNTLYWDYTKYALHDDGTCTGGYTQVYSAHASGTNQSTAIFVTPFVNAHATGLHFYTSFATPVTATCTLYINAATPTALATGTVATSGRGLYQCTWTSTAMTAGAPYYFAVYTPGDSTFLTTCNSGGNPPDMQGQPMGPNIGLLSAGFFTGTAGGNNPPTITTSSKPPIAPEFTVP